jgi:hypothetical protein
MPAQYLMRQGEFSVHPLPATGGRVDASAPPDSWSEETIPISSGDRLVFVTPGFADLQSPDGTPLDPSSLGAWIEELQHQKIHEAKQGILQHCRSFIQPGTLSEDLGIVMADVL